MEGGNLVEYWGEFLDYRRDEYVIFLSLNLEHLPSFFLVVLMNLPLSSSLAPVENIVHSFN